MTEKCELAGLLGLLALLNLNHLLPLCWLEHSDSRYIVPCRRHNKASMRSDD